MISNTSPTHESSGSVSTGSSATRGHEPDLVVSRRRKLPADRVAAQSWDGAHVGAGARPVGHRVDVDAARDRADISVASPRRFCFGASNRKPSSRVIARASGWIAL
jgi:hypothetical protein